MQKLIREVVMSKDDKVYSKSLDDLYKEKVKKGKIKIPKPKTDLDRFYETNNEDSNPMKERMREEE